MAPNCPKEPSVSVIMRTKNSDWVIHEALEGLFSQTFTDFELIVVDSGSTDRTLEILEAYPHRLFQIEPEDYHPGRVLNDAVGHARGDVLVFQNSDGVPLTPSTLERLVGAFTDPRVDAALARQLPRPEADAWVRRDYAQSFPAAAETPPWITISLPLAAMRRCAWEQHPFHTVCWGSEDTEWGKWARDHGLVLRYVPESLVMHSHNYTLRQLFGRRFIEGEADAFIYGRNATWAAAAAHCLLDIGRDLVADLAQRNFREMPSIVPRRLVYWWAYTRGHRWGQRRLAKRDFDPLTGQRIVLATHESNRQSA